MCGEVGGVTASDIDSTDDGKITYNIVPGIHNFGFHQVS